VTDSIKNNGEVKSMKAKTGVGILVVVFAAMFLAAFLVGTDTRTSSAGEAAGLLPEKWWPSKYGADDERGANNLITPGVVMGALKIPKTGQIYKLTKP
jgi:hypothetical protein